MADGCTVATAQTTPGTSAVAGTDGAHYGAVVGSVVDVALRTHHAAAVASQYGHSPPGLWHMFYAEDSCNLSHDSFACTGTVQTVKRAACDAGGGEVTTSTASACAAVGSGKQCLDFVDTRVFVHLKAFRCEI